MNKKLRRDMDEHEKILDDIIENHIFIYGN